MDELDKDEEEELDETGFGHDLVSKKGKGKGGILLPDDDILDAVDEPVSLEDEPDEESLDKLADDEDTEDSFDDEDTDQW